MSPLHLRRLKLLALIGFVFYGILVARLVSIQVFGHSRLGREARGQQTSRVILEGLKKYGMLVADNGSDWFITGATDSGWSDEDLNQLKTVPGNAFEVVQSSPIMK